MIPTYELIPYMRSVETLEREMRELGLLWQMIESSAAISCPLDVQTILPTLVQTRERFDELQRSVVRSLAAETLAHLQDELNAKAQCAIDILIRNLFERTADVGFLATDDVIRAYCLAGPEQRASSARSMRARLHEYRAKYTVYDDIIVLDSMGNVLVRLDETSDLSVSTDPIVHAALSSDGYVERFARSDLAAGSRPALLYGHRIVGEHRAPLGVLVLRFRFEDEMQRIFNSVADAQHQYALALLDNDSRVIASNDPGHVPLDIHVRPVERGRVNLVSFAGREYLATSCATNGYQSYKGPGWRAHAMVSLLTAFRSLAKDRGASDPTLANAELKALQMEANAINRNLRRVVWNGRLMAGNGDTARLNAVLTQVNQAGARTSERVRLAVGDLHATSLDRACRQAAQLARLAVDIMDRNLYERANDCRWWALSPVIRRVLSSIASDAGTRELNQVLEHINGLYTVYRRLVVFDSSGVIRGLSHENHASPLLGSSIDKTHLEAARRLSGTQDYAVSSFCAGALSDGEASYTYLAAVRGEFGGFVGGIAIVFHTVREFAAMLSDVMGEKPGFAAFVDENGTVLACSSTAYKPGDVLPFDGSSPIANLDGRQFATTRARAPGYREFKTTDGYDNRVEVVVALQLGSSERLRIEKPEESSTSSRGPDRSQGMDVAIVRVGRARYALPAARVVSAHTPTRIVQAPHANRNFLGLMQVDGTAGRPVIPVISARQILGIADPAHPSEGIAVVLRRQADSEPAVALWVDDVVTVTEIERGALQEAPEEVRAHAPMIVALFDRKDAMAGGLIQLIDPDRIERLAGLPDVPPTEGRFPANKARRSESPERAAVES
jgi:chemotaxis signal transduction protein